MSQWSIEEALKSSDVYSWERSEVSTSSDCDVILVVECTWKNHIGETGHVWASFIMDENHSQEWCDEDNGMWNNQQWVLWVWASLVSQFSFIQSLRIISVLDSSSLLNSNASYFIWMEVNSGKSIQSLTSQSITLNHNTRTTTECPLTKDEWFERRHI